jgi:hypothetical protein
VNDLKEIAAELMRAAVRQRRKFAHRMELRLYSRFREPQSGAGLFGEE